MKLTAGPQKMQREKNTSPAFRDSSAGPRGFAVEPPGNGIAGLPEGLKAGIEGFSGIPVDDVRVHYNSPEPARLHALAYAQGPDIHLAPGRERHLPHEAWHVVQQRQGRVKPTLQAKGVAINIDASLENEAETMGARVLAGTISGGSPAQRHAPVSPGPSAGVIQMYPPELLPSGKWFDSELGQEYDSEQEAKDAYTAWRASLGLTSGGSAPAGKTTTPAKKGTTPAKKGGSAEFKNTEPGPTKEKESKKTEPKSSGKKTGSETGTSDAKDTGGEDESFYANENGYGISGTQHDRLMKLIDTFDVALDEDVRTGASAGSDAMTPIFEGVATLASYIESQKGLATMLEYIAHPGVTSGSNAHTRNLNYKGKSFMEILTTIESSGRCHNDVANAFREILSTLKLEEDE